MKQNGTNPATFRFCNTSANRQPMSQLIISASGMPHSPHNFPKFLKQIFAAGNFPRLWAEISQFERMSQLVPI
jgi:hypothetical protein